MYKPIVVVYGMLWVEELIYVYIVEILLLLLLVFKKSFVILRIVACGVLSQKLRYVCNV